MLVEVKVPQLSESVAEATLVSWHRKAGEYVKRDENLVDIETDKVVLETPAPDSGVLVKIVKGDGGTVVSQEVIATIDTEAKPAAASVQIAYVDHRWPPEKPIKGPVSRSNRSSVKLRPSPCECTKSVNAASEEYFGRQLSSATSRAGSMTRP